MLRFAVFVSGNGSNLQAIIDAVKKARSKPSWFWFSPITTRLLPSSARRVRRHQNALSGAQGLYLAAEL